MLKHKYANQDCEIKGWALEPEDYDDLSSRKFVQKKTPLPSLGTSTPNKIRPKHHYKQNSKKSEPIPHQDLLDPPADSQVKPQTTSFATNITPVRSTTKLSAGKMGAKSPHLEPSISCRLQYFAPRAASCRVPQTINSRSYDLKQSPQYKITLYNINVLKHSKNKSNHDPNYKNSIDEAAAFFKRKNKRDYKFDSKISLKLKTIDIISNSNAQRAFKEKRDREEMGNCSYRQNINREGFNQLPTIVEKTKGCKSTHRIDCKPGKLSMQFTPSRTKKLVDEVHFLEFNDNLIFDGKLDR